MRVRQGLVTRVAPSAPRCEPVAFSPSFLRQVTTGMLACLTLAREAAFWPRRRDVRTSAFLRSLAWFGPDLVAFLVVTLPTAGLALLFGYAPRLFEDPAPLIVGAVSIVLVALAGACVALPAVVSRAQGAGRELGARACRAVRDFLPAVLLLTVYLALCAHGSPFERRALDEMLYRADVRAFGVEPSTWALCLHRPDATVALGLVRSSVLLQPILLGVLLVLCDRRDRLRALGAAAVLVSCASFVLGSVLLAGSPAHYLHYDAALGSAFDLHERALVLIDRVAPSRGRASFPSLPAALVTVTWLEAWKSRGIARRRWLLPFSFGASCLSFYASAIYFGDQWAVDVAGGALLGVLGYFATQELVDRWPRARSREVTRTDTRLAA